MKRTFLLHHAMATRNLSLLVLGLSSLWLWLPCQSSLSQAQVPPITPSGPNTHVSDPIAVGGQTQYDITGGTRPRGGLNLFHSFGDFGVPPNNIANFLNTGSVDLVGNPLAAGLPTSNILARVTGSNGNNPTLSSIYGTIQTTGFGNANLFLMNPAGFLFGPNATVNVGGMVAFTSADYLKLTDNARFNAIPNAAADALLTASPVAAFGFLGSNPGAITVQGSQFTVTEGAGISLVGGNITIEAGTLSDGAVQPARLSAPGGQINLASVASPGEVSAANFLPNPGMAMGTINVSHGSTLDVSSDAAGIVRIRGGQFVIADSTISADTVNGDGAPTSMDLNITGNLQISDTRNSPAITARTTGTGNAGDVRIAAANFEAISTTDSLEPSNLIDTGTSGAGRGGSVTIHTGILEASSVNPLFNFISTGTLGEGNGGDVTITAAHVQLQNTTINTGDAFARRLFQEASGSAGNLTITADSLQLNNAVLATDAFSAFTDSQQAGDITLNVRDINMNSGAISAIGVGRGGAITVNADRLVTDFTIFDSDTVSGPGRGITVNARAVELTNGSTLVSTTFGDGNAGDIYVTATDHLSLIGHADGQNPLGLEQPTGLYSNSFGEFGSQGNAGNIVVITPRLEMTVGSRITAATASSGHGGNVAINADTISISREFPNPGALEGTIWDIKPLAPSGVFSATVGNEFCSGPCGNAGHITITTRSLVMDSGAQIDSGTSNTGHGGDITIHAANSISMSGTLSDGSPVGVFSRTIGTSLDSGNGGNIELHAPQVQVSNGANVSASTSGPGNAGNISILGSVSPAQTVLVDGAGSGIFTDTQGTGAGGDIFVNADSVMLQNGGTLSAKTSGTEPTATGGSITLNATDQVIMTGGASITASSTGPGKAGNISISGDSLTIASGGRIEASTSGAGNAGLIAITTTGDVTVSGVSTDGQTRSGIFAKTQTSGGTAGGGSGGGSGGGGNGSGGGSGGGGATPKPGSAGDITITANDLLLDGGAQIDSSTTSGGAGGNVSIKTAENITIAGSSTRLTSDATRGNGKGGNITLVAKNITVRDSASVTAATGGKGDAGNVTLTALDQLLLQSAGTVTTSTSGSGKGGTITIQAGQVLLDGPGTSIAAETLRPFADMTITINILHLNDGDLVVQLDSPTGTRVALLSRVGGTGDNFTNTGFNDQATMQITSGSAPFTGTFTPREPLGQLNNELVAGNWTLNVRDQATGNTGTLQNWTLQIGSQTFQSTGGSIVIPDNGNVRSTITVANPTVPTVQAVGESTGIGGNVTINAGTVTVQNGATMSATTRGSGQGGTLTVNATGPLALTGAGSGLFTESEASGAGGNIFVNANTVTIENGGTLSAATSGTATTAIGGTITVNATNTVTMSSAKITASSAGVADAGSINITSPNGFTMQSSTITTQAGQGAGGGNIKVTTSPAATVLLQDSLISASVADGHGGGGNIEIDPQFVILQNSQILAQAAQGQGGAITITAGLFLQDANSKVNADSGSGLHGTVTIQSPNAPASGKIQPLGKSPLLPTSLLTQRCASLAGGEFSSFTVGGRDSLPTEPGSWLASPLATLNAGMGRGGKTEGVKAEGERPVARGGDIQILSLRQIAPAGFLTQAFAVDWSAGCTS